MNQNFNMKNIMSEMQHFNMNNTIDENSKMINQKQNLILDNIMPNINLNYPNNLNNLDNIRNIHFTNNKMNKVMNIFFENEIEQNKISILAYPEESINKIIIKYKNKSQKILDNLKFI
jgi:hypothetical protein